MRSGTISRLMTLDGGAIRERSPARVRDSRDRGLKEKAGAPSRPADFPRSVKFAGQGGAGQKMFLTEAQVPRLAYSRYNRMGCKHESVLHP
jgi:hypothetical protein